MAHDKEQENAAEKIEKIRAELPGSEIGECTGVGLEALPCVLSIEVMKAEWQICANTSLS